MFKLFYIADSDGISDLTEAYKALLVLKIGEEEGIGEETVLGWVTSRFKYKIKVLDDKLNSYYSRYMSEEEKEAAASEIAKLKEKEEACTNSVTSILENCEYLATPLRFVHGELVAVVNPRSDYYKSIDRMQQHIEHVMGYSSNLSGWAASNLERQKKMLLECGKPLAGATLFVNARAKKMCSSCIYSMDRVEGLCSPGGPKCPEGLNHLFQKEAQ